MNLITLVLLGLGLVVLHVDACDRLTGAFRDNGGPGHLFFGNHYVQLDENNKEMKSGDVYTDYGVNYPDAAFQFSFDHKVYFFSGNYYYGSFNGYQVPVETRYFGGAMTRFYDNGIDAAGNFKGSTYFFKGCKYIHDQPSGPSKEMDMPKGAPCSPDAALTDGHNLMLFKDDQMWLIRPEGDALVVDEPVQTDSVIHLNDIVLCKKGEKEE